MTYFFLLLELYHPTFQSIPNICLVAYIKIMMCWTDRWPKTALKYYYIRLHVCCKYAIFHSLNTYKNYGYEFGLKAWTLSSHLFSLSLLVLLYGVANCHTIYSMHIKDKYNIIILIDNILFSIYLFIFWKRKFINTVSRDKLLL